MNPTGVQPYVSTTSVTYARLPFSGNVHEPRSPGTAGTTTSSTSSTCAATRSDRQGHRPSASASRPAAADGDGGVNPMKPTAATIYVDSFWLEGSCGGDRRHRRRHGRHDGRGRHGRHGRRHDGHGRRPAAAGHGGRGRRRDGRPARRARAAGQPARGTVAPRGTGTAARRARAARRRRRRSTTSRPAFRVGPRRPPRLSPRRPEQHFDGAQSLKITHGALDNANILATVRQFFSVARHRRHAPRLSPHWLRHEWRPLLPGHHPVEQLQALRFDRQRARTGTAGAWNTWTYTVPNTFPGGLQVLGFQLGDNSTGPTIAAGSVYLDAITATGGTQNCAVAIGTGAHTFEAALDANVYKKDGSDADTVATQSTDR